ncbi:hypothetical protein [Arsukibacterium indicum]|uniref:Uncharacterized protein n=1 Tax=Arsukibacterium indicum TaxID=2848612 RepID=A0ABS6MQI3_9GAMM|nr:hypothetical protein [Arsukibacterium indicum]MBV2131082.1 hypothetical protein [Arsukibacterium indicum]
MADVISNIITGIFIAGVTAYITVHLSVKRFRQERWWEKQVVAYEKLIEALHHSKAFSDEYLSASYECREVSETRDKELRAKSAEAHREIEKVADVGGFLLSTEVRQRIQRYRQESDAASETTDWVTYLEGSLAATSSCLEDIVKIARKELKIDGNEKT